MDSIVFYRWRCVNWILTSMRWDPRCATTRRTAIVRSTGPLPSVRGRGLEAASTADQWDCQVQYTLSSLYFTNCTLCSTNLGRLRELVWDNNQGNTFSCTFITCSQKVSYFEARLSSPNLQTDLPQSPIHPSDIQLITTRHVQLSLSGHSRTEGNNHLNHVKCTKTLLWLLLTLPVCLVCAVL